MSGTIQYTIRPYDTIWMLAQVFNTSVDSIMDLNPGVDPRNLYIGQVLTIRPGHQYYPPQGTPVPPRGMVTPPGTAGTTPRRTTTPGGMVTPPSGTRMTPGGMATPPSGTRMTPGGMATPPTGTGATPGGMATPPSGTRTTPGGMATPPSGTGTTPGGMTPPSETRTTPGGMATPPSGTGTTPGGMATPPSGTGTMPGGMTPPSGGTGTMPGEFGYIGMENMDDMDGIDKDLEELRDFFRMLWSQHVYWTRMAVMGIADDLPDAQEIQNRLLRNSVDFANALMPFYGEDAANDFEKLFTDHLTIAAELITAVKAGDTATAEDANKRWHENADMIAAFLASINPYWAEEDWSAMMDDHLNLLAQNSTQMIQGKYEDSVNGFDEIEMQALEMADVMADGIAMQFAGY